MIEELITPTQTPVDYNYHNSPEFIQQVLDSIGGVAGLLTFCQTNYVGIELTDDCQHGCVVGNEPFTGYYAIELDPFSAMVRGVAEYKKRNPPGEGR